MAIVLAVCASVVVATTAAGQTRSDARWWRTDKTGQIEITLYFFWSETCPHCAQARPFVQRIAAERSWLKIDSREVSGSADNRRLFASLAAEIDTEVRGVPTFFICRQAVVGYDDDSGIGALLLQLVERCRAQLVKDRSTGPVAAAPRAETVRVPTIGDLDTKTLSLPLLTVVLGGMDAFNPCAFFVLLFLLSLMVHARNRGRMLLIGGVFVLSSGLLYFAFMAAWLNLFLVFEGMDIVTRIAGVLAVLIALFNIKDFVIYKGGPSLAIPQSAKPGLFARMRGLLSAEKLPTLLVGATALAIAANFYELLCTSGFPLVYTRILTLKSLPDATYYLYLALYNLVYVLPLLVIVIVFAVTLGTRKLTETQGRVLKLLSGLMMLGLGLVLLIRPGLLNNLLTSVLLLIAALAIAGGAYLVLRAGRRGDRAGPGVGL